MDPLAHYRQYRILFSLLLSILFLGFFIGVLVYAEPFDLLRDPFSALGASETPEGYGNRTSMAVFIITMVLTAILFVCITVAFARDRAVSFRGYRITISILAAFGACIATFPHNYFLVQHQVGAGFLVGSIWLHTVFFIRALSADPSAIDGTYICVYILCAGNVQGCCSEVRHSWINPGNRIKPWLSVQGTRRCSEACGRRRNR